MFDNQTEIDCNHMLPAMLYIMWLQGLKGGQVSWSVGTELIS